MKKLIAIVLVLALAIGLVTAGRAEEEKDVFTWQLERVIQGGETYWAKDLNKLYLDLDKEDDGARFTNLYRETEETPEFSWGFSEDKEHVVIENAQYGQYVFALSEDVCRMTFQAGEDRQLVFVLWYSSGETDGQPEDIPNTTVSSDNITEEPEQMCAADYTQRLGTTIRYRMPDGNAVVTYNTDFGPFRYVVDIITGKVIEKDEPDLDAVRAQEGFRDPLNSEELRTIADAQLPIDSSIATSVKSSKRDDETREYTYETIYGTFIYVINRFTGEVVEKSEPDVEAIRAQEGFTEPITSGQALDIARDASGLEGGQYSNPKVSKNGDKTCFIVTFDSAYGDYSYTIEIATGKILERVEPDVDAARAQEGFVEPMTEGEAMDLASALCPVDSTGISKRLCAKDGEGGWIVTYTTVYGDCIYHFNANRDLVEKSEPDIAAAQEAGVKEPLSVPQCMDIAIRLFPLQDSLRGTTRVVHNSDGSVNVILPTEKYGDFSYKIDPMTGDVLEKTEPDYDSADVKQPASVDDEEALMWEAIDTAYATLPGFNHDAEDTRVKKEARDGDTIIVITFTWHGEQYEFHYSVNERKLVD